MEVEWLLRKLASIGHKSITVCTGVRAVAVMMTSYL